MKFSKKSKVLALTLSATMLVSAFTFSVSAATTGLGDVVVDGTTSTDVVSVTVPYTFDTAGQQVTILATVDDVTEVDPTAGDVAYGSDLTTPTNIVYIDQKTDDTSKSFSFSFNRSILGSNKYLYIKVGGTDVSSPAESLGLVIPDNGPVIVFGDVNGDGSIDASDASLILQRFAGIIPSFSVGSDTAGDVNGDTYVDASDASLVLQYFAGIITKFSVNN